MEMTQKQLLELAEQISQRLFALGMRADKVEPKVTVAPEYEEEVRQRRQQIRETILETCKPGEYKPEAIPQPHTWRSLNDGAEISPDKLTTYMMDCVKAISTDLDMPRESVILALQRLQFRINANETRKLSQMSNPEMYMLFNVIHAMTYSIDTMADGVYRLLRDMDRL